ARRRQARREDGPHNRRRPRHAGADLLPRALLGVALRDARWENPCAPRREEARRADRAGGPMSALRIYVPGDAAAVACRSDELAAAITALAARRQQPVVIVRNGSRGMHWLEPMLEVVTGDGRIAYGPVEAVDLESVFDAMLAGGGPHKLRIGVPEEHPF